MTEHERAKNRDGVAALAPMICSNCRMCDCSSAVETSTVPLFNPVSADGSVCDGEVAIDSAAILSRDVRCKSTIGNRECLRGENPTAVSIRPVIGHRAIRETAATIETAAIELSRIAIDDAVCNNNIPIEPAAAPARNIVYNATVCDGGGRVARDPDPSSILGLVVTNRT